MDRYLENGGAGLWCEVEKAVETDEDGEPELVELRNMLPVHAVQSRVRRIVARYTRLMSHYGTTHWKHDWVPELDKWLEDGDFDQLPGHQRRTACSACKYNVRIGRDKRCLNIACHDARRGLHELSQQRERDQARALAVEAARRRLFEDEPPAGMERLIITDVPGQQPGARVAVFEYKSGSAEVEAMMDDFTEEQIIAVAETLYGDEYEYSAQQMGVPRCGVGNISWAVTAPAHQVERQAQRERRDALFGSANRTYAPAVLHVGGGRIKAWLAVFDRDDGGAEVRAMKHDVSAAQFRQLCYDLATLRETRLRPGDVAEDGDTWSCVMTSRRASQPSPAPVVAVPPPEPVAPPAPELQAELLATKSTWLRDPKHLTGEYLDGLFEIAQDVAGTLTGEQANAIMANIERAMAHVQSITGKLITLAVAVEDAAPEGTFADGERAAPAVRGGAAQAA
jgi:hypothetical protein